MPAYRRGLFGLGSVIAVWLISLPTVVFAEPKQRNEFPERFHQGPLCWHYENAEGEQFLLKLRALALGPTSFIVSGVLAGTEGGQYPIMGNAELLKGRVKSSLMLNDAYPAITTSTFLSGVMFIVDLDPATLNGVFEWISPTLSGPDPEGPRLFQAFSSRGTMTLLSHGRRCERLSMPVTSNP
jgi:hypothetical protein